MILMYSQKASWVIMPNGHRKRRSRPYQIVMNELGPTVPPSCLLHVILPGDDQVSGRGRASGSEF